MKKLIPKTIFALALCSIVALTISFTSKSDKKEVMIIKTFMSFETEATGLAILHSDESIDYVGRSPSSTEGDFFKDIAVDDGKMLLNTLQRFYDQGWELSGIIGGELPTYILTR